MKIKTYILTLFSTTLLLGCLLALFNWHVDPASYFGRNPYGLYHYETLPIFKSRMIERDQYDSILIGSSKVDIIPPETASKWGLKMFNGGILGVHPEEILYYLQTVADTQETIIAGFDFYMSNGGCKLYKEPDFADRSLTNLLRYTLSTSVTRYSIQSLKWNRKGRLSRNWPTGNMDTADLERSNAEGFKPDYALYLGKLKRITFCNYKYSSKRMQVIPKIVEEANMRGARLIAFLNPVNPVFFTLFKELGIEQDFKRWHREMKKMIPGIIDLTFAPYSKRENFYWNDPAHFTLKTGKSLLELVLRRELGPPVSKN